MKNNKGFTLIELLVVVLIIGILAAIALPQYRRAVAKAEAAQLYEAAAAMIRGAQTFYAIQDKWPTKIEELDIHYDLPVVEDSVCKSSALNGGIVRNEKYEFVLGSYTSTEESNWNTVSTRFADGPYKCTGFMYHLKGGGDALTRLLCFEKPEGHSTRGAKNKKGDFCEKVMGYSFYTQMGSVDWFTN